MERAKEIEIIQSLKGDTYFAQLFGDEQIDAMCQNIRNDYPIECGLEIFQGSRVARENARLKEENEILLKASAFFATKTM